MTGNKQGGENQHPATDAPALTGQTVRAIVREEWEVLVKQFKKDEARKPYRQEKQKLEIARFAAASQWLIASLLAVSLGGLVFVGDSSGLDGKSRNFALLFFFLGVVLALFAGLANQQSAKWHMIEAKVALGGARPKHLKKKKGEWLDNEIATMQSDADFAATLTAWASFLAFIIASILVGAELSGQID